jgi:acid stress chaperone HdeB
MENETEADRSDGCDVNDSGCGQCASNNPNGQHSLRPIFGYAAVGFGKIFCLDERLVQLPDQNTLGRFTGIPAKYRKRENLVPKISERKSHVWPEGSDRNTIKSLGQWRMNMKCNVFVVALTLLGAVSMPAAAQIKLDMNKITCKDFLGYNSADQIFVQYWMSGYYNAAANSDVLDLKRLQNNSAKVMAYCKKNKADTLPTAIQKSAG